MKIVVTKNYSEYTITGETNLADVKKLPSSICSDMSFDTQYSASGIPRQKGKENYPSWKMVIDTTIYPRIFDHLKNWPRTGGPPILNEMNSIIKF